ncbi:MAG TPA: glycosyltransferase [Acidimicrobiales bacterium]|nr:glycosyltransferase [Acidimicrobiales bacterium]
MSGSTAPPPAPGAPPGRDGTHDHRAVAAVVVTYEPQIDAFLASLRRTLEQVGRAVVVDNGSTCRASLAEQLGELPSVELVSLEDNLGIAAALNIGISHLAGSDAHDWVLTLDQDTTLHDGAIAKVLSDLADLDAEIVARCGTLGLRWRPFTPPMSRLWARAEQATQVRDVGVLFRERRFLITSGNLVRREVATTQSFEDELFIDQVDCAFSAAVRAAGWLLLEHREPLMDHEVGELLEVRGRPRRYERGLRLYYIVRNSTVLLRRRELPLSLYLAQLTGWARTYVAVHGVAGAARGAAIVLVAWFDACTHRMGRRDYRLLAEPRSRRVLSEPSALR